MPQAAQIPSAVFLLRSQRATTSSPRGRDGLSSRIWRAVQGERTSSRRKPV